MVRYYLKANCGYAEYKAKLDIEKVKKEYDLQTRLFKNMFSILVSFAVDYGKEKTDISPNVSDYDPYLTEIYVSREDMHELKKNFPNADYNGINIE